MAMIGTVESVCLPENGHKTVWKPGPALGAGTNSEFAIEFRSPERIPGQRTFLPVGNLQRFIAHAWVNGLAILRARSLISAEEVFSYRMMWFLYQRVQSTREALGRRFRTIKDLLDKGYGATGVGRILPDDLGLNADNAGRPWSIAQLVRAGEELAASRGTTTESWADKVNFGLYAAALSNPLRIYRPAEVAAVVRLALFMPGPTLSATPEERAIVDQRLIAAFEHHLEENGEQFDKWFSGPKNSLVTQLAKQSRASGGPLNRDLVSQVLHDRGWDAFAYIAQCLEAQFRAVMGSMDPPMTPEERLCFEQYYCRQPYWAGLPLLLLLPRLDVLRPVILYHFGLATESDPEWIPIAHRLLCYYSEMVERRRDADRERKRPKVKSLHADAGLQDGRDGRRRRRGTTN